MIFNGRISYIFIYMLENIYIYFRYVYRMCEFQCVSSSIYIIIAGMLSDIWYVKRIFFMHPFVISLKCSATHAVDLKIDFTPFWASPLLRQ